VQVSVLSIPASFNKRPNFVAISSNF